MFEQSSKDELGSLQAQLDTAWPICVRGQKRAAQKEEMNAVHSFAMFEQSSKDELGSLQAQLDTAKKRLALNNEKKATAAGKMETVLKEKGSAETYLADTQQECL